MAFEAMAIPSVANRDIEFILVEVELSQIEFKSTSSGDVPPSTWIGHASGRLPPAH